MHEYYDANGRHSISNLFQYDFDKICNFFEAKNVNTKTFKKNTIYLLFTSTKQNCLRLTHSYYFVTWEYLMVTANSFTYLLKSFSLLLMVRLKTQYFENTDKQFKEANFSLSIYNSLLCNCILVLKCYVNNFGTLRMLRNNKKINVLFNLNYSVRSTRRLVKITE